MELLAFNEFLGWFLGFLLVVVSGCLAQLLLVICVFVVFVGGVLYIWSVYTICRYSDVGGCVWRVWVLLAGLRCEFSLCPPYL